MTIDFLRDRKRSRIRRVSALCGCTYQRSAQATMLGNPSTLIYMLWMVTLHDKTRMTSPSHAVIRQWWLAWRWNTWFGARFRTGETAKTFWGRVWRLVCMIQRSKSCRGRNDKCMYMRICRRAFASRVMGDSYTLIWYKHIIYVATGEGIRDLACTFAQNAKQVPHQKSRICRSVWSWYAILGHRGLLLRRSLWS